MRPRIIVTRRVPQPALDLLASEADTWLSPHDDRPLTAAELHSAIEGVDAVVTLLHDRVDDAFFSAAGPQLKCVANVAVGYDNIDLDAAARHGVVVTNTPGVLTDATADLAMSLILAITRRIGEGERLLRASVPWSWHMFFMLGTGLRGKTLGIVGLGGIGYATALRARAFGMNIIYSGRRRTDPLLEEQLGDARHVGLDELLATADVVSLHCPLNADTRHLINAQRLRTMRSDAYLINTARGPIVDEAALVDALRAGTIGGAGLDVFEQEPHVHAGLLQLDNVVMTPHLGSATIETRTEMAVLAARNAIAVSRGRAPITPVATDHGTSASASGDGA